MNFIPDIYSKLTLEKLIIFSILSVLRRKEECTFERLVKESYTLFPESFKFYRYPEWPDSLKLDRPLRDLRRHRYIVGNPKKAYSLTKLGEKYALIVEKELGNKQLLTQKPTVVVGRKEKKLLDYLKTSAEFQKYLLRRTDFNIDKTQIVKLSFSTMDTPPKSVIKNLESLKDLSRASKENNLESFLSFCIEKYHGRI